jgi:hypothetical protein
MKSLIASITLAAATATCMSADSLPPLQIDQMQHVTNAVGKIIPRTILYAQVGGPVCLHLQDGTELKGTIIRREEALKEYVKIYGELTYKNEQCGFGLVLTHDGKLQGALLFRESQKTYTVEYDDLSKGFVFKFQKQQHELQIN